MKQQKNEAFNNTLFSLIIKQSWYIHKTFSFVKRYIPFMALLICIHKDAYLASGSSNVSKFSQRVDIILSYLLGYFLKMSFITTIASWTT